jgi:hypothetical protein
VIESQEKAKSKIIWRRQVSDPLGKDNDLTHSRQNYAQGKSANHQTKARKPQRAPLPHMQAPPELMQLPLDECMQNTSQIEQLLQPCSDRSSSPVDRWIKSSRTWEPHRSDRCPSPVRSVPPGKLLELKTSSKPLGNACSKPNHAQTSPPCWECMNQAKKSKKCNLELPK